MRVSKTVKEYIAKKVREAYAEKIKSIGKEYYDKRKELEDKISEMEKEFKERAKTLIKENCGTWNFDDLTRFSYYSVRIGDNDYEQEIRNKKCEIEKERNEKIEEIIVTLELGGTKADLEKMLSDLEV